MKYRAFITISFPRVLTVRESFTRIQRKTREIVRIYIQYTSIKNRGMCIVRSTDIKINSAEKYIFAVISPIGLHRTPGYSTDNP